jgi:hypothetical protein
MRSAEGVRRFYRSPLQVKPIIRKVPTSGVPHGESIATRAASPRTAARSRHLPYSSRILGSSGKGRTWCETQASRPFHRWIPRGGQYDSAAHFKVAHYPSRE